MGTNDFFYVYKEPIANRLVQLNVPQAIKERIAAAKQKPKKAKPKNTDQHQEIPTFDWAAGPKDHRTYMPAFRIPELTNQPGVSEATMLWLNKAINVLASEHKDIEIPTMSFLQTVPIPKPKTTNALTQDETSDDADLESDTESRAAPETLPIQETMERKYEEQTNGPVSSETEDDQAVAQSNDNHGNPPTDSFGDPSNGIDGLVLPQRAGSQILPEDKPFPQGIVLSPITTTITNLIGQINQFLPTARKKTGRQRGVIISAIATLLMICIVWLPEYDRSPKKVPSLKLGKDSIDNVRSPVSKPDVNGSGKTKIRYLRLNINAIDVDCDTLRISNSGANWDRSEFPNSPKATINDVEWDVQHTMPWDQFAKKGKLNYLGSKIEVDATDPAGSASCIVQENEIILRFIHIPDGSTSYKVTIDIPYLVDLPLSELRSSIDWHDAWHVKAYHFSPGNDKSTPQMELVKNGPIVAEKKFHEIDFAWWNHNPTLVPIKGIPADFVALDGNRRFRSQAGKYRLEAYVDDGIRVFMDGKLQIDSWKGQFSTFCTSEFVLQEGEHEITFEYFQRDVLARLGIWMRRVE